MPTAAPTVFLDVDGELDGVAGRGCGSSGGGDTGLVGGKTG